MAKIIVGGTAYNVPLLKFKALKKVWPEIQEMQQKVADAKNTGNITPLDAMAMADVAGKIISMALVQEDPSHDQDWLDENLDVNEIPQLGPVMLDMLVESGLVNREQAEAQTAELGNAVKVSTATSTPSSPNSSPQDAQAETGTQ